MSETPPCRGRAAAVLSRWLRAEQGALTRPVGFAFRSDIMPCAGAAVNRRVRKSQLARRENTKWGVLVIALAAAFGCLGARAAESGSPMPGALVSIDVDLKHTISAFKPLYAWFGMDEANYATSPNGRKLLVELHDMTAAPVYIRSHNLFTSGDGVPDLKWSSTNVYSEDAAGQPVYDFRILDGIFDSYKQAGVKPLVELGFMPQDLASESGEYHLPWPSDRQQSGAVFSPPSDYRKWESLVRTVVNHFVERYGREAVLQWYFEVWNEPDLRYWHGTAEEYLRLYDHAAAGVKAALPGARIGGPGTTRASEKGPMLLEAFLRHATNGKSAATDGPVPLDFITFHAKGIPEANGGDVRMGIQHEVQDFDRGLAILHKFPKLRQLPVILTEADPDPCAACTPKTNPATAYRNGPQFPAYTAAAYKSLLELTDRYRQRVDGMVTWSFMYDGKPYFEGYRTLATNGVDKPILNFFRMTGMMRGMRVAVRSTGAVIIDQMMSGGVRGSPDVDAMATIDGREAAVMIWNYSDDVSATASAPIKLHVKGLSPQGRRVLLSNYRIDDTHSNALTVWKAMGSPQDPTAEQYGELVARGGLELLTSPTWTEVSGEELQVEMSMPANSVSLLRLTW